MILVLLVYFLFASTFTLGKAALYYCDPILLIGIRMTTAGILLLIVSFIQGRWRAITRQTAFLYAQIIIFHIYCAYVFEFLALTALSSSKTALLYNFSPFITALISYFFLRDNRSAMTGRKWLGLAVGGVGMLFWIISSNTGYVEFVPSLSAYELALLIAVTSAAYGWIVMHTLVVTYNLSPLFINGVGMLGGGILASVTSLIVEGAPHIKIPSTYTTIFQRWLVGQWGGYYTAWASFIAYLLLLIIIANGICYNLYGNLLKRYSPTLLSFAGFTCPLFTAILGWFFHGEGISFSFIATVGIVFCGLYIFYQEEFSL